MNATIDKLNELNPELRALRMQKLKRSEYDAKTIAVFTKHGVGEVAGVWQTVRNLSQVMWWLIYAACSIETVRLVGYHALDGVYTALVYTTLTAIALNVVGTILFFRKLLKAVGKTVE